MDARDGVDNNVALPNNRLHTDSALRASADGRSEFAWFSSQHWLQADVRAERVKRDVRPTDVTPWVNRQKTYVSPLKLLRGMSCCPLLYRSKF